MAGYRPPRIQGLDRLLEETVEARPAATALITGPERTRVSYAQLAALVENLARFLPANGLRPGNVVAVETTNNVEFVVALLGSARAGMVVAPLDSGLASEERTDRLERLGARIALTDKGTEGRAGDHPTWKLAFRPGRVDLQVTARGKPRPTPPGLPHLAPDDKVIMFTAGTTDQPKMVPWTYQSITAVLDDICTCYELGPADATVGVMPFFHGHGLIAGLLATLASGGCVLLPVEGRFSAHTFWSDLGAAKATWFTAVPTVLEILKVRASSDRPSIQPAHLRFVRTCSAPLNPATARAFRHLVGAPVLTPSGQPAPSSEWA
jgi:acyl-CoA synthetase (AMP-forming)/AMP-acid ligase II